MTGVSLIVYPAADTAAVKPFFQELTGTDPYAEGAMYVGYRSGEVEVGLVPASAVPQSDPVAYWTVDDIAARVEALVSVGGSVAQPVTDVGYGLLVATLRAPGGAIVGLRQMPRT